MNCNTIINQFINQGIIMLETKVNEILSDCKYFDPPNYRWARRNVFTNCYSCNNQRGLFCKKYKRPVRPGALCDEWSRAADGR
jgi:hypothetical protein